jgi:hypothetical protein
MIVKIEFFPTAHTASVRIGYGVNRGYELAILQYAGGHTIMSSLGENTLSDRQKKKIKMLTGYLHTQYTVGLLSVKPFKSDLDLKEIKIHGPV